MAILGDSSFKRSTIFGDREIPSYLTDDFGSVPQIVYKYLDLSKTHNKESLTENYMWFSDPTSFNDPFDCKTSFAYHLLAEDEILCRDYYKFHSVVAEPNLSVEERQFSINSNVDRILSNKLNIHFFKDLEKQSLEYAMEGIKRYGVFCTCMINDNILLWSHYANSHRGIAIGLRVEKLLQIHYGQGDIGAGEIKYGDFPLITPLYSDNKQSILDTFQPFFLTKAPFWNYELEYRFLDYPCVNRKKTMDNILDSIYMGCDISADDETFVKEICKKNQGVIKLYKAEKAFYKYGIEFNEILY